MRYWVVKGNPRENDLDVMLSRGALAKWRTGKPPKKWRRGDRLFFRSSAPRLEFVGLGQFLGETGEFTSKGETIYAVKYLTNPLRRRVRAADLRKDANCRTANFLKPAVAQGVLEIPDNQARRIYAMLNDVNDGALSVWKDLSRASKSSLLTRPDKLATRDRAQARLQAGQGFGDPESNAEVEQAAIKFVAKDYGRRGWIVESVERTKCGYDLECRRGASWEYVEVKGIRGSACSFLLTAGEFAALRQGPGHLLVAVCRAVDKPTLHRITADDVEKNFRVDPIAYRVVPITAKRKPPSNA
jgi:hypothetical protein